ncbi:NPC intracellular cholesterol transporter 2-like [Liolophura sinensis]|uniref:NPC intracellular cholesterol transporter 2-like n=1 Tax=Liolophura sinensis TaxID=3198878 RepID=UPI003158961C
MFLVICSFLLLGLVTAEPVTYKDCGSAKGKINSVDLSPCPSEPCYLKKGTNVSLTVKFTSNEAAPKLTTVVHGILAGVPVPFPVPNPDGCTNSGITCPIANGQTYSYTAILPVLSSYPSVKVVVQWELKDENTDDVFCFAVPVEIGS